MKDRGRTPEEIYDGLLESVNFDPVSPGWTSRLVDLHRYSLKKKLQIIPEHFYTPVFSAESVPDSVWSQTLEAGVDYDADRQLALLTDVQRFGAELETFPKDPPDGEGAPRRYFWNNTQFSHGDAVLYYSMIRHFRPRLVIEVGGGFSTLLASEAAVRNGATSITTIEPYPRPFLEAGLPRVRLVRSPAQEVEPETYQELGDGDILFIDGSHVCKTGSDVNFLLLQVLPRLARGVWVHIHDIFLPFEYPRTWVEQLLYWNEQYVLAALLSNSSKFEPAAAMFYLSKTNYPRLALLLPKVSDLHAGGVSYWIRCIA